MKLELPSKNEYGAFYQGYVDAVSDREVPDCLEAQLDEFMQYLESLDEKYLQYSYAPGKWTVGQVIGHMIDVERVFGYRAFSISRKEPQSLPGFDQEPYIDHSTYLTRNLESLSIEFEALRIANWEMIHSLSSEQLSYEGMVNGERCTVRAMIFLIAGHFQHHFNQLNTTYKK